MKKYFTQISLIGALFTLISLACFLYSYLCDYLNKKVLFLFEDWRVLGWIFFIIIVSSVIILMIHELYLYIKVSCEEK
jgi:hypothetical protein